MDGTIGDTQPLCIKAFRQSIEPLIGRSVSDAAIIAALSSSEEGTIMALAPDHYHKGVADYLQHYETFHTMCPAPFDGVADLLQMLKENGVRIAMATGKGKYSTIISLKQFGLENYFEAIETGMAGGQGKPERIQVVLNHFSDLTKEEIIYVGNAPGDITAARQVGLPVIAAAWAKTAEPEKLAALQPDEIFYRIADFANWLHARI